MNLTLGETKMDNLTLGEVAYLLSYYPCFFIESTQEIQGDLSRLLKIKDIQSLPTEIKEAFVLDMREFRTPYISKVLLPYVKIKTFTEHNEEEYVLYQNKILQTISGDAFAICFDLEEFRSSIKEKTQRFKKYQEDDIEQVNNLQKSLDLYRSKEDYKKKIDERIQREIALYKDKAQKSGEYLKWLNIFLSQLQNEAI